LLVMGIGQTIEVANLGMADSLILMVMALVVFGPRRLPQIGRQIGKLMYEFRKASNDFKFQMEEELRNSEEADRRKKEEERRQQLALAAPAPVAAAETAGLSVDLTAKTETTPAESSYSYQDSYCDPYGANLAATMEQDQAASQSEATPVAQAEEAQPRIQPPSTGEQVAAAAPNQVTQETAPGDEAAAAEPAGAEEAGRGTQESTEGAEQAAHHG
jgi:sec-independent protein translocase protein TatB